jgi:hypothetical protein
LATVLHYSLEEQMKVLGRRWLVAMVLGALAAPLAVAHAQTGKLTGVVLDEETGKPLEGVAVTIQGTTLGNLTNASGRYFIISAPPGRYSVQARRIGYQSVVQTDVVISIDNTRQVDFKLKASQTLQVVTVRAEQTPLIERGQVGSGSTVTADQIASLPVTSIAGVLSLQQGFQEIPQNTSVISLAEEQRSTTQPISVRGARSGSTLSMIDGVPINNPLFGSPSVTLAPLAVQQVDSRRGSMDPQYGNATSGLINSSIREGGSQVSGTISFQNSTIPGKLFGTMQDQLLGNNLLRGYLAGPVPGTNAKVRYSVSGQVESKAQSVLEFDQDVFSVNENVEQREVLPPYRRDLSRGWQAFGGAQNSQIVGKLTFLPFADTKINLVGIGAERSNKNYERRYAFTYRGDPLALVNNRADSLYVINDNGNVLQQDVAQPSVRDQGKLYLASLSQRFGRSNLELRVAQTDFERVTCPYFRGTCLPETFCLANFAQGFINPSPSLCNTTPDQGGLDQVYGGEKFTSRTFRADLQSQVTDHNNIQFGAQLVQHDMNYSDQTAASGNSGIAPVTYMVYRAKPVDAAAYVQAVIEYDFLTVRLGGRFDYGRAKGLGFTDPFDPSNGTTARQICEGATVAGNRLVNAQGQPYGTEGCFASAINPATKRPVLLDSATKLAQLDDFSEAKARTAFSPRIGVNFPLTEKSQIFFNAGRYTKVPNYGDVYRNTGIGTVAGAPDRYCAAGQVKPGTNECVPDIKATNPTFVGNPNLLLEEAKGYEVGYSTTLGANDNYGLSMALWNRAETGLTAVRNSRAVQDIGSTYDGSAPSYTVLVNGDFLTARGAEINLDRRLSNRWSYGVNYGISRATTNGRPPEKAEEINRDQANRAQLIEALVGNDVTHVFNLQGGFRVQNDIPDIKWNLGRFLRRTGVSATYQFSSGIPYTPVRATSLATSTSTNNAAENLSGRQPSVQTMNIVIDKQFTLQNVNYSAFFRVSNLLDRKNCNQVFPNTGTCKSGLRDFGNRSIGNTGDVTSSTGFDQPEYIAQRRSLFTGITVSF